VCDKKKIAVLIPCYNEALTIEKVIKDFQEILPSANIYVFDNNSTDRTAAIAKSTKAEVILSPRKGKGNVVQHMFRIINADIYVLIDGDNTYPVSELPKMLSHYKNNDLDIVVGMRLKNYRENAFRLLHKFGNNLISNIISFLFNTKIQDALSGFRILSKHFVKNINLISQNFEIETEMTIRSIYYGFKLDEFPITYNERPKGSVSKLNTFRDGLAIFRLIFILMKSYKPGLVYYALAFITFSSGFIAGFYPIMDYYNDKYIYNVPLIIIAVLLEILSAVFCSVGIILTHRKTTS